jgi:hypothetical protein
MGISDLAVAAGSVTPARRDDHVIPLLEAGRLGHDAADLMHHAGDLVAKRDRRLELRASFPALHETLTAREPWPDTEPGTFGSPCLQARPDSVATKATGLVDADDAGGVNRGRVTSDEARGLAAADEGAPRWCWALDNPCATISCHALMRPPGVMPKCFLIAFVKCA